MVFQNADLLYFTGSIHRASLYIPAVGEPILFVPRGARRPRAESAIESIVDIDKWEDMPRLLRERGCFPASVIGLESDVVPENLHSRIRYLFAPVRSMDVSGLIRQCRMIKSAWETARIRDACRMGGDVLRSVRNLLQEGISERELSGQIANCFRSQGHPGYVRTRGFNFELTHHRIRSGQGEAVPRHNSSLPGGNGLSPAFPETSSLRNIGRNEPVSVALFPWADGYMADMARVFCIGALPIHMEHAYNTALALQQLLIREAKPGAVCREVWSAARQLVRTQGLCDHFMGMAHKAGFVANGVGIEADEWPVLSFDSGTVLAEGMVLAVRPRFEFPDGSVALTNTFRVGPRGLESLGNLGDGICYLP